MIGRKKKKSTFILNKIKTAINDDATGPAEANLVKRHYKMNKITVI